MDIIETLKNQILKILPKSNDENRNYFYLMIIGFGIIIIASLYFIFIEKDNTLVTVNENEVSPLIKEIGDLTFADIKKTELTNKKIFKNEFITNNLPTKLFVYQINKATVTDSQSEIIKNRLNLPDLKTQRLKTEGDVALTNAPNRNLIMYKDLGSIIYTDNSGFDKFVLLPKFDENTKLEEYEQKAKEILSNLDIGTSQHEYKSYSFRMASVHMEVVNNPKDANLIELEFLAKIDGFPIIGFNKDMYPSVISITLDKDKNLRRLNAVLAPTIVRNKGEVTLKNELELKEDIINGNPVLVDSDIFKNDEITDVLIEKAEINYYAKGSNLVPIFVLDAKVKAKDGQTGYGKFFVDALKR